MRKIYCSLCFFISIGCQYGINNVAQIETRDTAIVVQDTNIADDTLIRVEEDALFEEVPIPEDDYDLVNAYAYVPRDDNYPRFTRDSIEKKLADKVTMGQPLVAHISVPLCDNEHQGIVPTSKSLGDGFSLRTNLYWATRTGMKRYFKENKGWKLLKSVKNVYGNSTVLERVILERTYPNKATVYLVADAYRGDKMLATVNDFLRALSNNYTEKVSLDDSTEIAIHGAADLVVFNGHNGQMDFLGQTAQTMV